MVTRGGRLGAAGTEHRRSGSETRQRFELVGSGGELCVFVVGELEVGCFGVAHELVDRGGAGDGDDVATPDDPCQGDLSRCAPCAVHRPQRAQQLVTTGEVLVEEQRVGEADAAGPMVGVVLGGEKPWASGL